MSAEAPKEAGTTAPVTPQKPEGVFSRFFGRLFAELSESQHAQQPVSRVVQPPPGLEDFAAKIQQGVDNHLSAQRQQELDRQNAEAAKIAAEVEKQALAAQRQRDLEDQERITREEAITEAAKVLKDFRIAERLEYIKATAWEDKGEIRPVSLLGVSMDGNEVQGGFEIIYCFTDFRSVHDKREHRVRGRRAMSRERSKIVFHEASTRLGIALINEQQGEKVLRIYSVLESLDSNKSIEGGYSWIHDKSLSHIYQGRYTLFEGKRIPIDAKDSEDLLDATLVEDIMYRRTWHCFPLQIEEQGRRRYAFARQHPVGEWTYDPPGEC